MKPWEMGFAADLPEEEEPKPWEMGLAAVSTEESGGHKPWEMGLQAASSPPQEQGLLPAIETGAGEGVGWGTPSPPGATPYALPQMGHPPVPFPSLSDQVARRMVELYPVPKTVPLTTRFRETPGAVEPLGLGSPEKATAIGQREIQVPGEAVPEMTEGEREALAAVPVKGEEPPAPPLPPHAPLDKGDSSLPYPLQVGKKIFNDLLGNVTAQAKAEARSLPADLAHGLLYTQSRLIDRPGGNMAAAGLGVASAGAALVGMENIAKGLGDWARYYSGGTEITDWVNQENARRYEEAAKAGVVPAIVHTVMDSAAEFFGLATHMGAIGGRGVFTPGGFAEQAVKVEGLKPIFSHIGKLAAYGALTREGDVKQRAFNALRMVGYNITPYIANATGATGLTATSVDTLLNTFLSSPDYVAAWQNSENVKEFAKFAIPLVVMDIGMAWKTRGLPENQARAFFEKHDRKSAKKLGMDVEAYRTLREAVRTEAARAALAEAHQVADIIEARAAGRPSPEKPGEMRADGKFADLLADEQYALQQVQRVRDLGFRVDSVKLSWDRKVFVDPRTEEGRQRMIAGGKTPKEIDNAIANDKVFQIFGVFRIDRGGGQEDRCEVEFFGDANRSDINHELVHLIDKLGGLPGWTGTSEQRAEWLGRAMAEGSAWNLPELRPETARVQQPAAPVAQPPGLGGPRKVQDMVDRGVEAGNRRIALRQALEAGPPAPDTPIQGQEGAKAPLSPESRGTGGVEGEMSAREVKQEETRPGLAPAGSTERGMANPYANERGETLGRLGKAWQRGYDGVPMTKGTARGTAAYKAYQEGKQARDVTGIPTAESLRPVLSKRTKGDNLENAIDLVNDLQNKGGEFTPEGYAIVYHRTTPENAEKIVKDQKMVGKEDGLFFGTKPSGQIDGYGDAVVRVEIPVEKLLLNDVFSDEAHVRLPTKSVGREIPVRASIPAAQPAPADITEGSRMLEPAPAEQFSAREEETRGPVWYSRLERAIEAIKQEKMSPDQLAAAVTKNVDSEERKWTGLDDWIAEKKAAGEKVTKAEALAFVRANAVELIEVTKRDWMKVRPDDYDIFAQFRDEDDPERARLMAATETEDARIKEAGGEVRFSTYQLPGGENYREVLLTLPVTEDRQSWRAWASENGVSEGDVSIRLLQERSAPSDVIQSFERHMFPASRSKQSFTSSHWDEPNILAHVRFNERQAANGDKTLFLEEVQSDWHQAGKKQGYATPPQKLKLGEGSKHKGYYEVLDEDGNFITNVTEYDVPGLGRDEVLAEARRRIDTAPQRTSIAQRVPDAPFKKTWHEMTFRRMLREAVAGGYDRIAWITGEQTAERYDLSKQVDEIRYGANDDGTYKIAVMKDGNAVLREEAATPDKLSELLGKDVTDRIVNRQGTQVPADGNRAAHTSLSGLNLKIGASWAKNFYDKALVNYANKFGKKFGARAEDVEIVPSPSSVKEAKNYNGLAVTPEAVTVHSLPITPQMRESIMEQGVQMFQTQDLSRVIEADYTDYVRNEERIATKYRVPDADTSQAAWPRDVENALMRPWKKTPPIIGSIAAETAALAEPDIKSIKDIRAEFKKASPQKLKRLQAALRDWVRDQTGDLLATYRYESLEDGKAYEKWLDQYWKLANTSKEQLAGPPGETIYERPKQMLLFQLAANPPKYKQSLLQFTRDAVGTIRKLAGSTDGKKAKRPSGLELKIKHERIINHGSGPVDNQSVAERFVLIRDPKVEQFAIIPVGQDGKAPFVSMVSSGKANTTVWTTRGATKELKRLTQQIDKFDLKRIIFVHNHTNGNTVASEADWVNYKMIIRKLRRARPHVVVEFITTNGNFQVQKVGPRGEQRESQKKLFTNVRPVMDERGGQKVRSTLDAARIGRDAYNAANKDGFFVMLTTPKGEITGTYFLNQRVYDRGNLGQAVDDLVKKHNAGMFVIVGEEINLAEFKDRVVFHNTANLREIISLRNGRRTWEAARNQDLMPANEYKKETGARYKRMYQPEQLIVPGAEENLTPAEWVEKRTADLVAAGVEAGVPVAEKVARERAMREWADLHKKTLAKKKSAEPAAPPPRQMGLDILAETEGQPVLQLWQGEGDWDSELSGTLEEGAPLDEDLYAYHRRLRHLSRPGVRRESPGQQEMGLPIPDKDGQFTLDLEIPDRIVKTPDNPSRLRKITNGIRHVVLGKMQLQPEKVVRDMFGKDASAAVIRIAQQQGGLRTWLDNTLNGEMDRTFEQYIDELETKYTPEQWDDIMALRGNPELPEGVARQKVARKRATLEMFHDAKLIDQLFDSAYKMMAENFPDRARYHKAYFRGEYKNTEKARRMIERKLEPYVESGFLESKAIHTAADAMGIGLELRNRNPGVNARSEVAEILKLKAIRDARDQALDQGNGIYVVEADKANDDQALNWVIGSGEYEGLMLHPDYAALVKNMMGANEFSRSPVLRTIRGVGHVTRSWKFLLPFFHNLNIIRQSIADNGPVYTLIHPMKTADTAFKSATGAIPGLKGLSKATPKKGDAAYPVFLRYLDNGGGGKYSWEQQGRAAMENLLTSKEMAAWWRFTRTPARLALALPRMYSNWVFEKFIPTVKWAHFHQEYIKLSQKIGQEPTDFQIQEIIREGQNFFGEMNEKLLGRSSTATSLLRLPFLAPGYAEGNIRTTWKALAQWSEASTGIPGGAKRSRYNIPNSLMLTAILAAIGTYLLTGEEPEWPVDEEGEFDIDKLRDMFKIKTGGKDDRGRDIYIDMLTYDRDYYETLVGPAVEFGKAASELNITDMGAALLSPAKRLTRRVGGMKSPSVPVIADMIRLSGGEALVDRWGNKVYYDTEDNWSIAAKVGLRMMENFEPIPWSIAKQMQHRGEGTAASIGKALAGVRPTYSEKQKRVNGMIYDIFDLKARRQKLIWEMGDLDPERRKKIGAQFNRDVRRVLADKKIVNALPYEIRKALKERPLLIGPKDVRTRRRSNWAAQ
jgi:hypothetical protein